MKIGILITHISEVSIVDFIPGNHDFVVYRNQIDQYAIQTTQVHYTWVIEQGYSRLKEQGVECIFVPPAAELLLQGQDKVIPLFQTYSLLSLSTSKTGKIGFVGDCVADDIMHQQRTNISSTYSLSERQKKHRNFNIKLPIRFAQTRHRATRLDDYSPRSRMINNLVKFDLHKIKDAGVDTLMITDRSYLMIHKSLLHHAKQITYNARSIINQIISGYQFSEGDERKGTIHINGNHTILNQPKRKHWLKKNNLSILERML